MKSPANSRVIKLILKKETDVPVLTPGSIVLLVIAAVGGVAIVYRLINGLGAATGLNDRFPWGIWISIDVLVGVALAAGGFTMAAIVYIFQLEKYHTVVRPAVLTALLGYAMVAAGITLDIGQPWRIVYPVVFWNFHSVMFEVAWCVMLYLTVLFLEFVPAVYQKLGFQRMTRIWRYAIIPLVIVGITLSFLHQSSLGALFLIVPSKLNALWYSPIMNYMFFLSAAAVGPAMVIFESTISSKVFRKGLETEVLANLGRASMFVLIGYLVLRLGDLLLRGAIGSMLDDPLAGTMFLLEIALGAVVPILILSSKKLGKSPGILFTAACLIILGVVLNRINTSLIGMAVGLGGVYFPTWMEIATTAGITAAGIFAFRLAVIYLPVFEKEDVPQLAITPERVRESARLETALREGS